MSADPSPGDSEPPSSVKFTIENLKCEQLPLKKDGTLYVKLVLDGPSGKQTNRTERVKGRSSASWLGSYSFEATSLELQLYQRHRIKRDEYLGSVKDTIDKFLTEVSSAGVSRTLLRTGQKGVVHETNTKILFSIASLSTETGVAELQRREEIGRAEIAVGGMDLAPSATQGMDTALAVSASAADTGASFVDTWDSLLENIKPFIEITDKLAGAMIEQRDRDKTICRLMETIKDVHSFLLDAKTLEIIDSHRKTFEEMGTLTVTCAHLIRDYTVDKNFWKRIVTSSLSAVDATILEYEGRFKDLKGDFQGDAILRTEIAVLNGFSQVEDIAQNQILLDMPYARGTGNDAKKCCLPGTRTAVLSEIHAWINQPDGEDTPRLLVLTGVAGCGKSAVSRTIAQHYAERKKLGSAVFFEEADRAQRHCGNLLPTIARDIANLDARWRDALYKVVRNDDALRHAKAISIQLENFILTPAKALEVAGPVVIVIDALDESGDASARRDLMRYLTEGATKLPGNFRILITARAEPDIQKGFSKKKRVEIRHMQKIDDSTIDKDIAAFIQSQLVDIVDILEEKKPHNEWCKSLVYASDHLFQWSATACLLILDPPVGQRPQDIFDDFISKKRNLDELYTSILGRLFKDEVGGTVAIDRFRRVMGNVLAAKEPLSLQGHVQLWRKCDGEAGIVEAVVGPLGSLLSGTDDPDVPVRALHTSFFDYLQNSTRSGIYFVDPTKQNRQLALACLRVMNAPPSGLRFNICNLDSSHKRNIDITDLRDRIQQSISKVLSYACRFVGDHMNFSSNDKDAEDLKSVMTYYEALQFQLRQFFLNNFLHWLEILSLEKHINVASRSLNAILGISVEKLQDTELVLFEKDAISFVRVFAPPISESAPHIYISALPFAPKHSLVYQRYSQQYVGTMKLSLGSLNTWPSALKTIEGHKGGVMSVAYSPDGKHIVSGSRDDTIQISDAETGEIVAGPFMGHTDPVTSVQCSPDGKYVASGSFDGTVRIWDVLTGETIAGPFEGHTDWVKFVAWSPDGKHVVSGSDDCTCRVWNIETGKTIAGPFEGHSGYVNCVVYSPDGKHIVSGSDDRTVRVWDVQTGQILISPFEGHTKEVNAVAYSPDGQLIASGSSDKTVRVWKIATGELVAGPFEGHSGSVTSIAYSPDGKFIVSGSEDKTVRIFAIETGGTVAGPFEGHSGAVYSVAYSPDGRCIVSGAAYGTIRVWDAGAIDSTARRTKQEHSGSVNAVAYSPDGNFIASGSGDMTICIWDRATGELIAGPFIGHSAAVTAIAYSPDGKYITSGSKDKTIRIWNAEAGELGTGPLTGHSGEIYSVGYSPDGKYIVSGSADSTICIWSVETREIVAGPLKRHTDSVRAVAYSPDGKFIASSSDDKTIRVWDGVTGAPVVEPFEGHTDWIRAVAYSPDGKFIASGSDDQTIRIWNSDTGKPVGGSFRGHSHYVLSVAYSPDGNHIVSGSADMTIRVWHANTGETIAGPFTGHSDWVNSVAYSPDGSHIVSGSDDRTIRMWDVKQSLGMTGGPASETRVIRRTVFGDDCSMSNGWVSTASGELLLWLPPWNRPALCFLSNNNMTIGPHATQLDLTNFVHGDEWQQCRRDITS
ncbi:hypothetical protein HWV62_44746 [Athelia sp. TMB]|nr:hypothetical protein HWV62_44746 [Athelia sp. TMB]